MLVKETLRQKWAKIISSGICVYIYRHLMNVRCNEGNHEGNPPHQIQVSNRKGHSKFTKELV